MLEQRETTPEPLPSRPAFRLGFTADFHDKSGRRPFSDFGLGSFAGHGHIHVSHIAKHAPVIEPRQLAGLHGVIVLMPAVTRASLAGCEALLAIGRFGVGFDAVDLEACTEANVLVTNTPGAVDRSVAEATIAWMLALTHRLLPKDRLVREGRWEDRTLYMGCELRDRTLGIIGLGGIGRKLVTLLEGFGMRQPVAFDPFVPAEAMKQAGVRSVGLEELLSTADFVSIHCPLNKTTRGLIGARELGLMKRDAYLLNTARGAIVDEKALAEALRERRIAGAALDCFEQEPLRDSTLFRDLDNVLLAPHCIAWTHEVFREIGQVACQNMIDVSMGRRPRGVLNPEVLNKPAFREKWAATIGLREPALLQS